jgi:XTP/dITP diphosphohydrolase
MQIRFVSTGNKFQETESILAEHDIKVIPIKKRLTEIQTEDVSILLKKKVISAFKLTGMPVFVEHTGLFLKALNGLPGGLTRLFWEKLGEDAFCEYFGKSPNPEVEAKTTIAYCDLKEIHYFNGIIEGKISKAPKGDSGFAWDRIFIPKSNTNNKTFAEIGNEKNSISMRKIALDKFAGFLKE